MKNDTNISDNTLRALRLSAKLEAPHTLAALREDERFMREIEARKEYVPSPRERHWDGDREISNPRF